MYQSTMDEILDYIDSTQVIYAIKMLRGATNLGLKDSKDAIDYARQGFNRASVESRLTQWLYDKHSIEVFPTPTWGATTNTANGTGGTAVSSGPTFDSKIERLLESMLQLLQEQNELLRDVIFERNDD